jgi:hypothetical protein
VEVACDGNGVFCFRLEGQTHERAWLCASPQLSGTPVCDWTSSDDGSLWQLITVPLADSQSAYATACAMLDYAADKEAFEAANTISELSEIENSQAYMIKNAAGLGIIYSNPSSVNLWLGESSDEKFSAAVNRFSENSMWLVIHCGDAYYLYNVGRRQFVKVPVFNVTSQPCTFQSEPFALEMTRQAGGFTFREHGSEAEKGFMCAAPQNAGKPVAQWTIGAGGCQWLLVKVPDNDITEVLQEALEKIMATGDGMLPPWIASSGTSPRAGGIYSLSGQRLNRAPQHGVFIQNGKKRIR